MDNKKAYFRYRFILFAVGALSLLFALVALGINEVLAGLFGVMFVMCLCTLAILNGLDNLSDGSPESGAAEDQPPFHEEPPGWVKREQDRE